MKRLHKEKEENKCVHTEHCDYNSCKYGEEDFCPVYLGRKLPSYPVSKRPDKQILKQRNSEAFDRTWDAW